MPSGDLLHEAENSKLELCDNPEGWDWEGAGRGVNFKKEGIYVRLQLIHVDYGRNHGNIVK